MAQEFLDYIEDSMLKKKVLMDFLWFAEFYVEDIKRRTRIGLERAKREEKKLGRPRAIKGEKIKELKVLLRKKVNISTIARILGVSRSTVYSTIKRIINQDLQRKQNINVE